MICLKNATLYDPSPCQRTDLWLSDESVVDIGSGRRPSPHDVIVEADNLIAIPGLVDLHVHITGGGGEAGMASRTPELALSTAIKNGVTSVGGLLGTDTVTRSLDNLLAKGRGLVEEGLSVMVYTGGYPFPSPTFSGSVRRDLFLLPDLCGVKIAFADHRSSYPTTDELLRLLSDVRVAGMLRNHVMQLHIHIGDDAAELQVLIDIVQKKPYLAPHLTLTHVNRSEAVFEMALNAAKHGVNLDFSSGLTKETLHPDTLSIDEAVLRSLEAKIPLSSLTVSSDGNGSCAIYDTDGSVSSMVASDMGTLFSSLRDMVLKEVLPLSDALALYTLNPAQRMGLKKKTPLTVGADADLLLLDENFRIHSVYARGRAVIDHGVVRHTGYFEKGGSL